MGAFEMKRAGARTWPIAALACALASGCMPEFRWISPASGSGTSSGAGGTAGAGGAGGSGGEPGCDGPPPATCFGSPVGPATNGPYGATKLYFGTPEIDPDLTRSGGQHGGALSIDGTRYVRTWSQYYVIEDIRSTLLDDWDSQTNPQYVFWDLFPRLTRDSKHLLSCHGGMNKCMLHRRESMAHPFNPDFDHFFQNSPPFDGLAHDSCFTPNADNSVLAFCSNRISADDDEVSSLDRVLWTARAIDPADLTQGFEDLRRHDLTHADEWDDEPMWVADDGETILFQSRRDGDSDLWVTRVRCDSDDFDVPVKITELSQPGSEERDLTLPSIQQMRDFPCNAAWAYFHRSFSVDDGEVWRVPVCEGAPCQP
jgi:hypothetical protein